MSIVPPVSRGLASLLILSCLAGGGWAQTGVQGTEFITSSSPLPNGTMVTTTFYPKSGAAPMTTLGTTYGGVPLVASLPPVPRNEQSVLQSGAIPAPQVSGFRPPNLSMDPTALAPALPPATAAVPTWGTPFTGPTPYLFHPGVTQAARYPYPQTTAYQLPSGTVYPYPAASTIPSLGGPLNLPPPPMPYASTRTAYKPLVQFQNQKPGTYLGQGWYGQPKAYVDGQPVRNLLRYMFP